jgi:hypothetical protein
MNNESTQQETRSIYKSGFETYGLRAASGPRNRVEVYTVLEGKRKGSGMVLGGGGGGGGVKFYNYKIKKF